MCTFVYLRLLIDSGLCLDEIAVAQPEDSWSYGGGKEWDVQIKVEECAVKNLQIRFGLYSECLAVRERWREESIFRR